jgi:putative endonuclease
MLSARPKLNPKPSPSITTKPTSAPTTKKVGDAGEDAALDYLQKQGLQLVVRNFATPGRGGGEVDLIMRSPDGTLVFVEVRKRKSASHGGAAASISFTKQRRIVFAARHYISRLARLPPCRFDVIAIEGSGEEQRVEWLRGAFDAT